MLTGKGADFPLHPLFVAILSLVGHALHGAIGMPPL